MFFVFLLYGLFSTVFIICKSALGYTEPLFLVGSRMFVAGILICSYQILFLKENFAITKKNLLRLLFLAFFNIYLTNACEVWGLQFLSSAKTCFIYSLSPFLSALFSFFLFSEKLSSKKWMGLIIGFVGFLPIILHKTSSEELTGSFLFFSWAELAVLIAATSSVYGWIILKQLINEDGVSPMTANGVSMLIGGSMALMHSYISEDWNPIPVTNFWPFLECSLALLLISNLICYNLYGSLLKKYTATFMSFAGFTTPLFTAILGWIVFGETVSWSFYVSMAIVFSGLTLFYQQELEVGYAVPQLEEAK